MTVNGGIDILANIHHSLLVSQERILDNVVVSVRLKGPDAMRFWRVMDAAKSRNPYIDKSHVIRELLGLDPPVLLTDSEILFFRGGEGSVNVLQIMAHSNATVAILRSSVPAGIPAPAADLDYVDLNELLASGDCVLIRVTGDSMENRISSGDLLVVDQSQLPRPGSIVVARIGDAFTIKVFRPPPGLRLVSINREFDDICPDDSCEIVGVVRHIIKAL